MARRSTRRSCAESAVKFDCPPLVGTTCAAFVDWVAQLYAVAAGHGGAHGAARAGRLRSASRRWRGCAARGSEPDRMTPARASGAGTCRATGWPGRRSGLAHAAGVTASRDRRTCRGRAASRRVMMPPPPGGRAPDPQLCASGELSRRPERGGGRAARRRRAGRVLGDAARRRHRLGQDRGLFRGGRRRRCGRAGRC